MREKIEKIVVVGDESVGKTQFIKRAVNKPFQENSIRTLRVDFALFKHTDDNQKTRLQFWDIAGRGAVIPANRQLALH